MRFMVVGTGFGETHLRWLEDCPKAEVEYLGFVNDRDRADSLAQVYAVSEITSDPFSIIARRAVDAVVVVTPPASHADITVAAAEADLLVFSDKPLAHTVAAAQRMVDAAREKGFVTFQWRNHSAFRAMKALRSSGEIGDVLDLDLQFHHDFLAGPESISPWRHSVAHAGAGSLGDQGVHLFDLVRFLVPGDWRVVTAATTVVWTQRVTEGNHVVEAQTDDIARAQLVDDIAPTRCARVLTSRVSAGHRRIHVTMIGTNGTAIAKLDPDDGRGSLGIYTRARREWRTTTFPAALPNPYREWLNTGGTDTLATFGDGIAAQRLMADAVNLAEINRST